MLRSSVPNASRTLTANCVAVARVLHDDLLLDAQRDPRLRRDLGEDLLALLVDRRVVERVHQHLVDALLDRLAILAAHAHRARRTREICEMHERLLLVVADELAVDLRAPADHLLEAEDVAGEHARRHRRELARVEVLGDEHAGDAIATTA